MIWLFIGLLLLVAVVLLVVDSNRDAKRAEQRRLKQELLEAQTVVHQIDISVRAEVAAGTASPGYDYILGLIKDSGISLPSHAKEINS